MERPHGRLELDAVRPDHVVLDGDEGCGPDRCLDRVWLAGGPAGDSTLRVDNRDRAEPPLLALYPPLPAGSAS